MTLITVPDIKNIRYAAEMTLITVPYINIRYAAEMKKTIYTVCGRKTKIAVPHIFIYGRIFGIKKIIIYTVCGRKKNQRRTSTLVTSRPTGRPVRVLVIFFHSVHWLRANGLTMPVSRLTCPSAADWMASQQNSRPIYHPFN